MAAIPGGPKFLLAAMGNRITFIDLSFFLFFKFVFLLYAVPLKLLVLVKTLNILQFIFE